MSTKGKEDFVFFWKQDAKNGIFSNWSKHSFTEQINSNDSDNGKLFFNTAEHYLMYSKAMLFGDLEIAEKILKESGPLSVKHLGRQVKNYNDKIWALHKENIMFSALKLKTEQNPDVKEALMKTGTKVMAEASPYDKIWGIGLSENDPRALDQTKWNGQNLLGSLWMKLRHDLQVQ
jgi:hypothetical protein